MFSFRRNPSQHESNEARLLQSNNGSGESGQQDDLYDEVSLAAEEDDEDVEKASPSQLETASRGSQRLRRRPGQQQEDSPNDQQHHATDKKKASKRSSATSNRRSLRSGSFPSVWNWLSRNLFPTAPSVSLQRQSHRGGGVSQGWNRLASWVLCGSFVLWFGLVILPDNNAASYSSVLLPDLLSTTPSQLPQSAMTEKQGTPYREVVREQKRLQRMDRQEQRRQEREGGIQRVIRNETARNGARPVPKKTGNVEATPQDCYRPDWQLYNFPNCNDVHDMDLPMLRHRQKVGADDRVGVIADGMWRSVWAVDPRIVVDPNATVTVTNGTRMRRSTATLAAAKIMKAKHEVDDRNFDRHRRDALAMERLTSSPYVVDIYGFCGNTVITEFIDKPLDDLIEDSMYNETEEGYPTILNAKDRIQLALDVARGVQALHDIEPGGPIVHADIQERQFLVTPDGVVKINDFNRCRIMALHEHDDSPCTFRIPQAPGKHRSPEEYEHAPLDEKLDVYSTANVLYSILTGEEAWSEYGKSEMQKLSKAGVKPAIAPEFRKPGTADAVLADLTDRAYEFEPKYRISAREIVQGLEQLLASNTTIPTSIDRKPNRP